MTTPLHTAVFAALVLRNPEVSPKIPNTEGDPLKATEEKTDEVFLQALNSSSTNQNKPLHSSRVTRQTKPANQIGSRQPNVELRRNGTLGQPGRK